jgi:glucose-6-phosphate isomerase
LDNFPFSIAITGSKAALNQPGQAHNSAAILPEKFNSHVLRTLSSMKGQFYDQKAFDNYLSVEDALLYEVYGFDRPEMDGELASGLSIVHPGKVGPEYFMTKGHFHQVLETAEVYYCLKGKGVMVMETPEGEWDVKDLVPGGLLYVPPCWAHRSVNTSSEEDLVTLFVYPANAGHNYGAIETQGFRKLVLDRGNGPEVVDNPLWQSPAHRAERAAEGSSHGS